MCTLSHLLVTIANLDFLGTVTGSPFNIIVFVLSFCCMASYTFLVVYMSVCKYVYIIRKVR